MKIVRLLLTAVSINGLNEGGVMKFVMEHVVRTFYYVSI